MVARNRSIKAEEGESAAKLLTAFIRKTDEGTIGKLIIEAVILLAARTQADGGKTLRAAAQVYGVDTDAVALKIKQEFAAKKKATTQRSELLHGFGGREATSGRGARDGHQHHVQSRSNGCHLMRLGRHGTYPISTV